MKSVIYVLTALAVFGLALWAYQENYKTQQVLKETQTLQRQIGAAQVRLSVLRAEWAYLNRPDRLRELADLNFDRLGLLPLRPDQFGKVDQVAYPRPPEPEVTINNAIDVRAILEEQFP
ncbi:cell division protein FtsL [Ruegeria sp. 2012CJ41-6]|uniref:Cell division protein FtsL n=1 Tax=Ruegeria spongiae TaxID=2942209 RepID=A0ABT0Q876_9RHOB|nr:cell division protein FtsL [Ruegeria spongiae]MCL6285373.1 cell division protein FtsL [Ruegeria spongiae]